MLSLRFSLWLSALVLSAKPAAEWPQFRGPDGQGVAAVRQLPVTWSESDGVVWKAPIPGLGWSSPAVAGGRVFVTTAIPGDGESQSLAALCIDAQSGQVLWQRDLFQQSGPVEIHPKNSHASASPVLEDDRVYVHFGPHGTAALTWDGRVLWKMQLAYKPRHGVGGSPALVDDRLIIACDGHDEQYVTALSAKTGKPLWRQDRNLNPAKGFSFCTPLIIEVAGRPQAVSPGSGGVMAFDPATGDELWRVRYDGYSVVPRPIYAGGLVIVSSGYDHPVLMAIDPTGAGDITETHVRWTLDRGAPNNPSPVAVDDTVYVLSDNGILTAVDLQTGQRRWQERLEGAYSASLLASGGLIYAQDEEGRTTVFRAGNAFELVAENTWAPNERTYSSFAAIDGALFLRSESSLLRVGSAASASRP